MEMVRIGGGEFAPEEPPKVKPIVFKLMTRTMIAPTEDDRIRIHTIHPLCEVSGPVTSGTRSSGNEDQVCQTVEGPLHHSD